MITITSMSFSVLSLLKKFKVKTNCLESLSGVVSEIKFNNDVLYVSQINNSIVSSFGRDIVLSMGENCYISHEKERIKVEEISFHVELLYRILKTCINKSKMDILSSIGKNFEEEVEKEELCKWIKKLPMKDTVPFMDYNNKKYFKLVCNIVLDDEICSSGKNKGTKKRNTLIRFDNCISDDEFSRKNEWIYIFTVNDRIVKIGGTRTGLQGRVGSYLCGHHVKERGKSGDCSKTNGFIYNTFEFYLRKGCTVKMYGYELPKTTLNINILDKPFTITAQTYHAYESTFMEDFKNEYGNYPVLCDNSDPDYKN